MRVLGVDPGTWTTGIGVVQEERGGITPVHYETLAFRRTSPRDGMRNGLAGRLKAIYDGLVEVIKIFQPDVMSLESVFFNKDFSAAVRIGEVRAVAMLAASHFHVEVAEYAPAVVKKAVVGNGQASKAQIQYMVKQLLHLRESPVQDAADALAVAICHCQASRKAYVSLSSRRAD